LDDRTYQVQAGKIFNKSVTLPLGYAAEEEKEWVSAWSVQPYNSLEISRSILEKIRNASGGEKVERMVLQPKGVYVATYHIGSTRYPVAIYSEKDTIAHLQKVVVSTVGEIKKMDNRRHVRYDDSFEKYVVFAFYEAGAATPSLIMQVEKVAEYYGKSTVEEWLKFLGILHPATLSLMQGVWKAAALSDGGEAWAVVRGSRRLSFTLSGNPDEPSEPDFACSESAVGFLEHEPHGADSINVHNLTDNGACYIAASAEHIDAQGGVKLPNFSATSSFYCNGDTMAVAGEQPPEYVNAARLSAFAQKQLYLRGKRDSRSYLKEYLGIDAKEIITSKSAIYSKPGTSTRMYLVKGDVVTVLEEQGAWLKIEYAGKKLVSGWIKKSDAGD
jgi:hypothetical protein